MHMFFRKTAISIAISSSVFSFNANAVVCVDAIGNSLQMEEMASSAARWIEEKASWASQLAQDKALSVYENMQSDLRASNEISAVTTSVSSTSNAHAEERYLTSPSACKSVRGAKALIESWASNCGASSSSELDVENHINAKIIDCQNGSGLHCDALKNKRNAITNRLVSAVENQDGEDLALMLDGGVVLGVGTGVMTPANQQAHDDALALILGVDDTQSLPRTLDGSLATSNDPNAVKRTTEWAAKRTVESIANKALIDVNNLYKHTNGKQSIMAQLEEQVKYYNSEEFLKLLTNTNDKSNLPSDWGTMHPEAKFEYLKTVPDDQKIVSSEQVKRMHAEMMSLQLILTFLNTKTNVTSTSLIALQNKVLIK